jgi:hypothetical protein
MADPAHKFVEFGTEVQRSFESPCREKIREKPDP